ncbi:MAG: hypothetical protein K6B41_07330 [Butyrivibrio sp.]|nr:hypothetical protein [Butyrivibrio sp.]
MYGIFMECWVMFKLYAGKGLIMGLFIASVIYLLIKEKELYKKLVIVIAPLIILAAFFIPFTRIVFVALLEDGSDTYYRILWTIPMGVIIAYAGCSFFARRKRIGLILMSILVVVSGSLVYNNQYVTKAENAYHIPQSVIDVCDEIVPYDDHDRVRAVFPSEMVHFVRQYDTDILMPYGRDIISSQWNYYNAVHEEMEREGYIDVEALVETTRQAQCSYIVVSETRTLEGSFEDEGLELINIVDGYLIYYDPEVIY